MIYNYINNNMYTGCHGCLFPDEPDLLLNDCLLDEEVLSIDWHYVIMQEFVDEKLASEIKKHSSVDIEEDLAKNNIIPFSKCLSKFTEEESIEGTYVKNVDIYCYLYIFMEMLFRFIFYKIRHHMSLL